MNGTVKFWLLFKRRFLLDSKFADPKFKAINLSIHSIIQSDYFDSIDYVQH